jgi:hypothetical protein
VKSTSCTSAAPLRVSSLFRRSALLLFLLGASSAFAAPRTQIHDVGVSVVPGSTAGETGTLIISGVGFKATKADGTVKDNAATPYVQLGTVALTVASSTPTEIVADVPADMDSGEFLLLVERRPLVMKDGVPTPKAPRKNVRSANVGVFALTLAGTAGPAGPEGPEGPQGPAGAAGPAGVDGATGPAGPAGPAGADGATGPAGPAGATGPAGPAGLAGADGATGPAGPAGLAGADGATGPAGPQGPAGTNGTSAITTVTCAATTTCSCAVGSLVMAVAADCGYLGSNGNNGQLRLLSGFGTTAGLATCGDGTGIPLTMQVSCFTP